MEGHSPTISGSQAKLPDVAALIQNIAAGDQSALMCLYDATGSLTFGLVLRIIRDPAAAEEALLDVYTEVWRRAASYSPVLGAPSIWLMTIARTCAMNHLRSGKFEMQKPELQDKPSEEAKGGDEATASAGESERQKLVRAAIEALSREQREAIELAYYSGLGYSEIALRLSQPLGAIKTRIRLGMIKLEELLRPVYEGQV